jgi:hypothetical protein
MMNMFHFNRLENLEKISNFSNSAILPVNNKKKSVICSMVKASKNPKSSNMCCHYCDKNNHNTADFRAIYKFNDQSKTCF